MRISEICALTIALCLAAAAAGAAEDRCGRERAELAKIRNLELPARSNAIQEKEHELTMALEDAIGVDKKIAAAKEAGAPVAVLDGYMKESVALREKIERLKADIPKRKTEKAALEQRAVELDTRIGMGCPAEMVSKDDFKMAIGKWENKARTLVIEFVDMNKANREYYPNEAAKVEGYVRKVPATWPTDRIKPGDLLFISSTVAGNVLSGGWITLPAKGECPKMPPEQSEATLTVDVASQTITAQIKTKQYWTPKCAWSDQVAADTILLFRVP